MCARVGEVERMCARVGEVERMCARVGEVKRMCDYFWLHILCPSGVLS